MTDILDLVIIQKIDTELQELEELLGDLPTKVDELKNEEDSLTKSVNEGKVRSKEIVMQMDKNTLEMNTIKEKIDKYKDQLFLVTNNKQYDALQHEMDHLKEQLNTIELTTLEISEEKDTLDEETKEGEDNLESLTLDLGNRRSSLEALISESSEKKSDLESQRTSKTKNLNQETLSKNDKIFSARNGLVVVAIHSNACGGCGSVLPPQIVSEIKSEKIVFNCDVCNRFLFWESAK